MIKYQIVKASPDDVEAIYQLHRQAYQIYLDKYLHFEDNPLDITIDRFKFYQEYPEGIMLILKLDQKIIGSIFSFLDDLDQVAIIEQLAIDPFYQGQGYGSILLNHLIDHYLKGYLVKLDTIESETSLVNFYLKNGFQIIDKELTADQITFLIMTKPN